MGTTRPWVVFGAMKQHNSPGELRLVEEGRHSTVGGEKQSQQRSLRQGQPVKMQENQEECGVLLAG